jgi:hypothetical protein
MSNIDVVRHLLEQTGAYHPEEFSATVALEKRFAAIAVLPVYNNDDLDDIATGVVKVLGHMQRQGMLERSDRGGS